MNYGAIYYVDGTPATDALVRERFTHMLTALRDQSWCTPSKFGDDPIEMYGYQTTDTGGGTDDVDDSMLLRWPSGAPVMVYGAQNRQAWDPAPQADRWAWLLASRVGAGDTPPGMYLDNASWRIYNTRNPETGEDNYRHPDYPSDVRDVLQLLHDVYGIHTVRNISGDWHETFEQPGVTLFTENNPDLYGPNPPNPGEWFQRIRDAQSAFWLSPGFSRAPSVEQAQLAHLAFYLLVRRADTILGFSTGWNDASRPEWMEKSWCPEMDHVEALGEPTSDPYRRGPAWVRDYEYGWVELTVRSQWDDPVSMVDYGFAYDDTPPEPDLGDLVEFTGDVRRRLRAAIAEADKAPASYARLASVMAEAGLQVDEMPGVLPVNVQANIDRARAALEAGE